MPAPRPLPDHPSLEQQKQLAKDLLRAFREGEAAATARVRAVLPDKKRIVLADAQFVLAREYGFDSWVALKGHVTERAEKVTRSIHDEVAQAFRARDLETIRRVLEASPSARRLIDEPLFSFDSPAIVHFAAAQDLDMVDLLLDLGADPNRRSGWWAGGFHALHFARGDVADRLLEGGAVPDACGAANMDRPDLLLRLLEEDPSRVHERGGDGQTPLHFARSREVVDILLDRGAELDARDVDHRSTPAQWMLDQKRGAGRFALAEYLVERGAAVDVFLACALGRVEVLREMVERDPGVVGLRTGVGEYGEQAPSSFHIYTWTIGQHLSPLQVAAQFDQPEALDLLRSFAGIKDRLIAACVGARREEASAILRERPSLIGELDATDLRTLPDAGWAGKAEAVALMLDLGFDAGAAGQDGGTVLHCAAWQGDARCVSVALRHGSVRSLIETRDPTHGSTPLGWCCHGARYRANPEGDYPAVARLLLAAGAKPGPNLRDAPNDVLAVIEEHTGARG